jgi:anti-sigma regulatory factor (Ser/Thr protein kinase)
MVEPFLMRTIFVAEIESLRTILDWIYEQLLPMEFDTRAHRQIELACEEAFVNIMRHAYRNLPEKVEVDVKVFPKSHVEIMIIDHGPPFNPLERPAPDLTLPLEEREIGGLGVHFIRQNVDEVRYKREGKFNILVLVKHGKR